MSAAAAAVEVFKIEVGTDTVRVVQGMSAHMFIRTRDKNNLI